MSQKYNYTCCLPEEMNECPMYEKDGAYCKAEETTCGMATRIIPVTGYTGERKEKWFDKYYQ